MIENQSFKVYNPQIKTVILITTKSPHSIYFTAALLMYIFLFIFSFLTVVAIYMFIYLYIQYYITLTGEAI